MVTELETIYVPQDERALRKVQRRVDDIDRRARNWAAAVSEVLPNGLLLLDEETTLLKLFLAQQRRLNQELDARNFEETPFTKLSRVVPFLTSPEDQLSLTQEAHRTVAARIESDIDREFYAFCDPRGIEAMCEPAIDWRVAIRYLAQDVHRLLSRVNLGREYYQSPHRFEVALRARDLAADIVTRREIMLDSVVLDTLNVTEAPARGRLEARTR
jgi:hypothetical protein